MSGIDLHFLRFTLELVLIFGLPPLVLVVCCHALLPNWRWTVLAVLVVGGIVVVIGVWLYEATRQGTGLEILGVPGGLLGVLLGNLLAIPIARGLRSLVNGGAAR